MCYKKKTQIWKFRNCLEATQLDNKVNYLEKNKTDKDSLNKIIKNS